jgi:multicomponent Na+:H+ antiporter subunit E
MKNKIVLFLFGLIIWLLLSWPPDWQYMIVGIIGAAFAAYITGDFLKIRYHLFGGFKRYLWFLYYVLFFSREFLKSGVSSIFMVLKPVVPEYAVIVKIRTNLKSDIGITFLINSITLSSRTLNVSIDEENGVLHVHYFGAKNENVERLTQSTVEKFETILKRIFE